jgi:hypothetical protein
MGGNMFLMISGRCSWGDGGSGKCGGVKKADVLILGTT